MEDITIEMTGEPVEEPRFPPAPVGVSVLCFCIFFTLFVVLVVEFVERMNSYSW